MRKLLIFVAGTILGGWVSFEMTCKAVERIVSDPEKIGSLIKSYQKEEK
jgi:hypothetical protein